MNKYKIVTAILIVVILVLGYFTYQSHFLTENNPVDSQQFIGNSATCHFNKVASAFYSDIYKEMDFDNFENNEDTIVVNFIDLDTDSPRVKGNNSEQELIIAHRDDNKITLIEKSPLDVGSLFSYQISKKSGIASWNKQYEIMSGSSFSMTAMGYCE